MLKKTQEIANYLSKYESEQGLIDPLLKKPITNSYGNSFYGLLCALLYQSTKKQLWLKRATKALNAEIDYIKKRKKINGVFRWEFKNYALINSYIVLENHLDLQTKNNIKKIMYILICLVLISGCSTTKTVYEDKIIYRNITQVETIEKDILINDLHKSCEITHCADVCSLANCPKETCYKCFD